MCLIKLIFRIQSLCHSLTHVITLSKSVLIANMKYNMIGYVSCVCFFVVLFFWFVKGNLSLIFLYVKSFFLCVYTCWCECVCLNCQGNSYLHRCVIQFELFGHTIVVIHIYKWRKMVRIHIFLVVLFFVFFFYSSISIEWEMDVGCVLGSTVRTDECHQDEHISSKFSFFLSFIYLLHFYSS